LGVRVRLVSFVTYVMSGLMVCAGGILQIMQLGNIHPRLGEGYEFIAIAAIVVGGISLFGGEGSIIPGLVMGGLTLVIVENGLTHLGVSPYAYPFVRGGIIFIAMYADAMKSRVLARVHVAEEREAEPAPG
jgi:ribose/xylose/arabinose/galactoside ABC-type transport system permease subunit